MGRGQRAGGGARGEGGGRSPRWRVLGCGFDRGTLGAWLGWRRWESGGLPGAWLGARLPEPSLAE